MELGIDNFVSEVVDPNTGTVYPAPERMKQFLTEVLTADRAGVDSFGVGEHHHQYFLDSAPVVILAAAAAVTERIRLRSAVTVLSADDPVRLFEQFATLDLISGGRAEMVLGRGSFTEAFPLFGLNVADYDSLFEEKLGLILQLREDVHPYWKGRHRPPLTGQGVFPRPAQAKLPMWIGVGGTPSSFVRAGVLGLPLMVGIIGGDPRKFRPLLDLYRKTGIQAGHDPATLQVGIHCFGFLGDSDQQAADDFWPGYERTMATVGRQRGLPAPRRARYDAETGKHGAFFIGNPETVAQKILDLELALGGFTRFTLQMTNSMMAPDTMLRSIELLGTEVKPRVLKARAGS
ncbi:LLM class flavin-dependent oxidoreductase [Micromonospora zingiberis]|uniref:LLM class flavin-dependent oxidoreductase n=1 Tax=Micromonospora zingiberis TaxID=2053011 RepID=A0A4R0FZ45_9ACTN|nr:LLM class flavin-dependent oxidoreductase [Micromonospora zingiberis]TCB88762.1 LLM class flavin-dependent oxidoreductase [Micromonospora zingiberis]